MWFFAAVVLILAVVSPGFRQVLGWFALAALIVLGIAAHEIH